VSMRRSMITGAMLAGAMSVVLVGSTIALASGEHLVLPVPDKSGIPKEKITLSIKIPPKIEVEKEIPKLRKGPRSAAWDAYDFKPFRQITRKDFVTKTLQALARKGASGDAVNSIAVWKGCMDEIFVMMTIKRMYTKMVDIHEHRALRKLGITVEEIENFQQVVEIMKGRLSAYGLYQRDINRELEDMIDFLRKTSGKGQLRIVEVKEQEDGSTILQLEIIKGE